MVLSRFGGALVLVAFTTTFAVAQNSRRTQPDSLLGKQVFWKDGAVAKVDETRIDLETVDFPARVTKVEGNWVWLGRAWVRKADVMLLDQAVTYYSDQVRRNAKSPQAWFRRANCWKAKGELNKALKDLDEAIRLDPKYELAYLRRGDVKDGIGDFTGAIRDYDEVLRLNPKDWAAYNNRGLAKGDMKDYAAAIADYDASLELNPKNVFAYSNRAWAKYLTADYAGAIADYEENIRLEPKSAYAYSTLAFIRSTCPEEKYRDAEAALREAEQAVTLAPKNGYSWNAKACALAVSGDFKGAIAAGEKALEDKFFAADSGIDGGKIAPERLKQWQDGQLWLANAKK
jgi:tetratricopeptide (TPR) repeat protein